MQVQPPIRAVTDVLAIVAKYPQPGRVKTRLGASIGHSAAAALYQAFLSDLAARFTRAATEDNYILWWACAPGFGPLQEIVGSDALLLTQRGVDFAERLYHVALDMRAFGVRRLVIMGSDSPHLAAALIREAFLAIEPRQVVLGPAEDGGYYLIGFDLAAGAPDFFRGIEMSTPHVLEETLARASALNFTAHLLPKTFDVDGIDDLQYLARTLADTSVPECPHTLALLPQLGLVLGRR